jgi:hypothetical protein
MEFNKHISTCYGFTPNYSNTHMDNVAELTRLHQIETNNTAKEIYARMNTTIVRIHNSEHDIDLILYILALSEILNDILEHREIHGHVLFTYDTPQLNYTINVKALHIAMQVGIIMRPHVKGAFMRLYDSEEIITKSRPMFLTEAELRDNTIGTQHNTRMLSIV